MNKAIWKTYMGSWWLPSAVFLPVAVPLLAGFVEYEPYLLIVFLALSGIFAVALVNLFKRRWRTGIANLLSFAACSIVSLSVFMLYAVFGSSDDGFADNLTIPTNIEIAIPIDVPRQESKQADDTFQMTVLGALNAANPNIVPLNTDIASLQNAHTGNSPDLKRYLATSKFWRVFQERGSVFATRRWVIGANWQYTLHGYYTDHNVGSDQPFQTRLTIGLSGKSWARNDDDTTLVQAGEIKEFNLKQTGTQIPEFESLLVIKADGNLNVEIFEQSIKKQRKLTKASLESLEGEFKNLVAGGDFKEGNIAHGQASLELTNSIQPGIYDARIRVNPGEAGMIYLKAFEVTQNIPLSKARLKTGSNEWIGWSSNADELFYSNTPITIYEGDWGKPYAARFEVWFVPDSGKAERKLLDRVFKIEGWQR